MYRDKIEIKALTVGARCQLVLSSRFEVEEYIGEKHRKQCQNQQNKVLNSKLIAEADTIIIGLSWRPWSIELLPDTLDKLRELGAKKVAVLSLKEQFQSGYTYASLELPLDEVRRQMYAERKKRVLFMNDSLQKLSPEVHYIDTMELLCDQAVAECEFVSDKRNILLYDRNHLTFEGTKYLGKKMNKLRTLDFLFN